MWMDGMIEDVSKLGINDCRCSLGIANHGGKSSQGLNRVVVLEE